MALKAVLQNLDGVPENLRTEYKEQDGKFYLDIEGIDDHHGVGALKRAKDYEKDNARVAKEKAEKLQADLDAANNDLTELRKNGIPKGDVDRLETSYKQKQQQSEDALNGKITKLTASLEKHLLDNRAQQLATEVAAKPEYVELLLPHIRNRMKLEAAGENEEHVVRVLDKDGKPSALNMDDLKKELLANKAFAAILTGSKANGGGAGGGGGGGGASKKLSEMNEAERKTFQKDDPAGFRAAVEADRQANASKY